MEDNVAQPAAADNNKKYKWLFFILLVLMIALLIWMNNQNKLSADKFSRQTQELTNKIQKLESQNGSLNNDLNSKSRLLSEYMPYLSLIRNLKLTDSAYASLPYKYGQQVFLMPDTTPVVINSISVTANQYEYSVKYIVRNKSGEYKSISISDLVKTTP